METEPNQVKWRGIRLAAGELYLPVRLTDGVANANINASAEALYTSKAVHSRIEKSLEFTISHRFLAVADSATVEILVKVGADKKAHGNYIISSDGKAYIDLFEAPTITDDGTGLTEYSINRQDIGAATTAAFHTPTTTDDGTNLAQTLIGTAGKFTGAGGLLAGASYWLFKKSQNYLVRATNKSGEASDIAIQYNWHEE